MEEERKNIEQFFIDNIGTPSSVSDGEPFFESTIYGVICNNEKYLAQINSEHDIQVSKMPDFSNIIKRVELPENLRKAISSSMITYARISSDAMKKATASFVSAYNFSEPLRPAVDTLRKSVNNLLKQSEAFTGLIKRMAETLKPIRAISILADNQFVIWERLDQGIIDKIIEAVAIDGVDEVIEEYFNDEENYSLDKLTKETKTGFEPCYISNVYQQSIEAFKNEQYELSLIGLFVVVDYLLSCVSGNAATSIYKRGEEIVKRLENDEKIESEEYSLLALAYTFEKTTASISSRASFSDDEEPESINRHWLLHGRSHRMVKRIDCLKIINYIYALLLIESLTE